MINNNTILNDYGINIKKRIIEIGITQRELASMVGIDEKHLSKIVRGVKKGWKPTKSVTSRRIYYLRFPWKARLISRLNANTLPIRVQWRCWSR